VIARLSGRIVGSKPDQVVLDVAGVGYSVHIPLSTFYKLADAAGSVVLHVHTHVREDAIQLFGFWTADERDLFLRLIAVTGIGPKIGLAILSGMGVSEFERAVRDGDRALLERIPGIGRKTAERVLLELRERPATRGRRGVSPGSTADRQSPESQATSQDADAVAALVHLGYSDNTAYDAIVAARKDVGSDAPIERLLRAALRALVR
jgi:Holliday junction DNA helicase RuvA